MDGLVELQLMQGMNDSQRLMFQAQMASVRKVPSTAVLLALFTGGIGGQFFYLGKTLMGVLCVLFCWTFIPAIVAVIHLFTISGTVRRMNEERARMIAAQIGVMSGSAGAAGSVLQMPPLPSEPVSHRGFRFLGALAVGLLVLGILAAIGHKGAGGAASSNAETKAVASDSEPPAVTANRKALIRKLIRQHVFSKVDKVSALPHVYVGRAFYSLPSNEKRDALSAVFREYRHEDQSIELMAVYDGKSGNRMGTFSLRSGLLLD